MSLPFLQGGILFRCLAILTHFIALSRHISMFSFDAHCSVYMCLLSSSCTPLVSACLYFAGVWARLRALGNYNCFSFVVYLRSNVVMYLGFTGLLFAALLCSHGSVFTCFSAWACLPLAPWLPCWCNTSCISALICLVAYQCTCSVFVTSGRLSVILAFLYRFLLSWCHGPYPIAVPPDLSIPIFYEPCILDFLCLSPLSFSLPHLCRHYGLMFST